MAAILVSHHVPNVQKYESDAGKSMKSTCSRGGEGWDIHVNSDTHPLCTYDMNLEKKGGL